MAYVLVKCPSCRKGIRVEKVSENQPLICPSCKYKSILSEFPVVVLRKVSCPSCRTQLTMNSEYEGSVTCPICKYQGNIKDFPDTALNNQQVNPSTATADVYDPNKTSINSKNSVLKPGTLVLDKGSCFPASITLKRGINIIGRKHELSQSTIQIETSDSYMSKRHINIDVIMKPDASFEHRLSDAGSVNGTFHNEDKLSEGEISILMPNDTLRIGRTTFKFIIE